MGGSGGNGGYGGEDLYGNGAGGDGGRAAYYSGMGGSGGDGGALSLESSNTVSLINVTISANYTGTSARGTDGGNGGSGGEGSTGGNGGDAGSGSDAGHSGSGAGISMPSGTPALTMFFNTIVLNNISIPSGDGW